MSNNVATAKRKVRKPINRMATRKPTLPHEHVQPGLLDLEDQSTMAALEWMGLTDDEKSKLGKVGVHDLDEYTAVRMGMNHKTPTEFISWVAKFGIGLVRKPEDLEARIRSQIGALAMAASIYRASTGGDIFVEHQQATRTTKVASNIRFRELSEGMSFYFSPYQFGTPAFTVWLWKCARRILGVEDIKINFM